MDRSDTEWIRSCLNGHPEEFRELVRKYQAPVLSYLTGRLGNRDEAEEVAQESFVRAYFALGRLARPQAFFGWLTGIADRVVLEHQRRRERDRRIALAAADRPSQQEPGDLQLRQLVAGLPEPYREVVLLRYYGGLSCNEVAAQLGMPLGTVTKTLSRAYAMLRESCCDDKRDATQRSEVHP